QGEKCLSNCPQAQVDKSLIHLPSIPPSLPPSPPKNVDLVETLTESLVQMLKQKTDMSPSNVTANCDNDIWF
ncbi:hypothetical protein BgiBS90_027997, partial [Biomphalaria glabrata]